MSTQTEITRLQAARNAIRAKLVELGLVSSTAKLDVLATAVESIENKGAVNAQVQEGSTYTIPKGYHNGSGVVAGVSGGGNYSLQEKAVTPTKSQQSVTADSGYYGLAAVTVGAIPENYNDTSVVTAGAADVLANRVIVNANGETIAGTMPNIGAVSKTLDTGSISYQIPQGYHSGNGVVKIVPESKTATPTKETQTITPTSGKLLEKVTVDPIPANYITTADADAVATDILGDKTAYVNGVKITGAMPNNGETGGEIDGLTILSYTIPAGYTSGGIISFTNDIEEALAAI